MTSIGERAEALIESLGIRDPEDLDIEAIAFDSGVEVLYERLSGCEATLVGYGDRAIATIKPCGVRGRERFSIGHELGHWHLHRGRSFRCRVDEVDVNLSSDRTLEKEADQFASHLLMPRPIFNPIIRQLGQPGFEQLGTVANRFSTSLLATAVRLANVNTLPIIVACYDSQGRKWGLPAADVPRRWLMKQSLDEDSFAYALLHRGETCERLRKQPADAWFDNDDADQYEVFEACQPMNAGSVLVLLYLEAEMFEVGPDWNAGRKYTERGSYVPGRRR